MTQTQSKELVTKEMIIGEVIEKYPDAAGVFSSYGIQCIGCHANPHEAIEQGALGHGMSEEEIDKMINEVNSVISGGEDHTEEHHQEEAEEFPLWLSQNRLNIKSLHFGILWESICQRLVR